jgi:O-antigen/teichoic acid export membrane protein
MANYNKIYHDHNRKANTYNKSIINTHEIKKNAFFGVLWGSGGYVFTQAILLFVKLILIRFLIPEEFGLAAMAYIIISSLSVLNTLGSGNAYIRDYKSDPKKAKNTLFYIDTLIIIIITLIGYLISPYVTLFFSKNINDPNIINTLLILFRVIALSSIINIIGIIPARVLQKNLDFQKPVIARSTGTFIYGLVAVFMAYNGYGVWSIIIAQIVEKIANNVILFLYSPFIPSLIFDLKIAKKYIKFGRDIFIGAIISIIITNGDDTLIGRIIGTAALGFYSISQHFAGIVVSIIAGLVGSISFPILSKLQYDKEKFSQVFFKLYKIKNMFILPSIGGSVILANWIVPLILGEEWLPIIPIFYILSVAALINHFVSIGSSVMHSLGKPEIIRNNKIIQFSFYIILIYPFIKLWGVIGVSYVMVIFALISLVHLGPKIAKEIPLFYSKTFKIFLKPFFATTIMMMMIYFLKNNLKPTITWMFILVGIGIIIYFFILWLIDKEDIEWDVKEALRLIKEKLKI